MFLAFPLNGRPDWRRPPVITLLLIALNCIIYFGPEQFDQNAARKAATYYAQSELPRNRAAALCGLSEVDLSGSAHRVRRAPDGGETVRMGAPCDGA
jgi:hypothetical protein